MGHRRSIAASLLRILNSSVAYRSLAWSLAGSVVGLAPAAAAGPAACQEAGGAAVCSGDQSSGVAYTDGRISDVSLTATTSTLAPPLRTPALSLAAQPAVGATGTALRATVAAGVEARAIDAPALLVRGFGGRGADGFAGTSDARSGLAGSLGGHGSAISLSFAGVAAATGSASLLSRATAFGLQTDLAATTDALAAARREVEIRNFMASYNAANPSSESDFPATATGRVALDTKLRRDTGNGFLTEAEAEGGLAPGLALLVFPYLSIADDALQGQIAGLADYRADLLAPPLPDELPGGLAAVLQAQSSGGNGGHGGAASPSLVLPGQAAASGGDGRSGGTGGALTVASDGRVSARGHFNLGILAESIGGTGGNGGASVAGPDGLAGTGGKGGTVSVVNDGSIDTAGVSSPGIFAQSVGGTGGTTGADAAAGTGGSAEAVSVDGTGAIATAGYGSYGIFARSLGGTGGAGKGSNGGNGGKAGAVGVIFAGDIDTRGDSAHGIFGASVGGRGGLGGDGGGSGGSGGASGAARVTLNAGATVTTAGNNAYGILAQSRGGAGGIGDSETGFWVSAGGGGNGGLGGDSSISNAGTVSTAGNYAHGLFAQALGGSGGVGGDAGGFVAFSGEGGGGVAAGAASITSSGRVATIGTGSHGVFVQSVAGGGGDAGAAGGFAALGGRGGSEAADLCDANPGLCNTGGAVGLTNSGTVATAGDLAYGLFAESVGGGGGNGGSSSGIITIGGDGGPGGNGGMVTAGNTGHVTSAGIQSTALFAQSIGGGGGNAGDASAIGIGVGSVSIGGTGGSGGDGSAVTVDNGGTLTVAGDRAIGLFAQSVGGGGGRGGDASSTSIGSPLALAIGGSGGGGGSGSSVDVLNTGAIKASGARGAGILAQSVGGGGGAGGGATSFGASGVLSVAVALGGSGGDGGDGRHSSLINRGAVDVDGADMRGVFVQSVGGGGGLGGTAAATAIAASPPNVPSVSVAVALGGNGGGGGGGGGATLVNHGGVTTRGDGSNAVQVQSIGGGGGSAGESAAAASAFGGKVNVSLALSLGGTGGDGGTGGAVTVSNAAGGALMTLGALSHGIFAQSVGGGGGDAGFGYGEATSGEGRGKDVSLTVTVGGKGGGGGGGGAVAATNNGAISTAGIGARAILAQSIGGGGGAAGGGEGTSSADRLSLTVGVGGTGGIAGDGGAVSIRNSGALVTAASDAAAVYLQSVGGGGGLGGSINGGSSAGSTESGRKNYSLAVTVGGSGGASGKGGRIEFDNAGMLTTDGNNASGIFAQSIGGGGGDGGGGQSTGSDGSYSFGLALGGRGGASGDGGAIRIGNTGAIRTAGIDSNAIFAQSIGGGGGTGGGARGEASSGNEDAEKGALALAIGGSGGASGNGGHIAIVNSGSADTRGYGAIAIFAQSVGGGGGTGGAGGAESGGNINLGAGIAGGGGASGDGGGVMVTNSGAISTRGHDAAGILAQSVGGGGGLGGAGNGKSGGRKSVGISIGGGAGATGKGGGVTVDQTGAVGTLGDRSYGVMAQSVGGGGGTGGGGAGENSILEDGGAIIVGGAAGAAGDGGTVGVTVRGNVQTEGLGAHAILAQSVGGGGGIGGGVTGDTFTVGLGVSRAGGGAGSGGAVDVESAGEITTLGVRANGIFAQSIGGGGGAGGSADTGLGTLSFAGSNGGDGRGGALTITHTGAIDARGAGASAIFAQSSGGSGAGDIRIILAGGSLGGGDGDGAGIYVDGGADNVISLAASTTLAARSGLAIRGGAGNEVVDNLGRIDGNLRLGGGSNLFNNRAGGLYVTGTEINLGAGLLINAGTLRPGGSGSLATAALTGSLRQTGDGVLDIDLRAGDAARADRIDVSGNANLAGLVTVTPLQLLPTAPVTILTAVGGIVDAGIQARDTVAVDYGLAVAPGSPDRLTLSVDVRFAASGAGLTSNEASVGGHLQDIWNAGGGTDLEAVFTQLGAIQDPALYGAVLDRLHPEPYLGQTAAAVTAGTGFTGSLMSCRGSDGAYAAIREQECAWFQGGRHATRQDSRTGVSGYRETGNAFQLGQQFRAGDGWFVGFALGLDTGAMRFDTGATSDARRYFVGASVKHQVGPLLLAGGAAFLHAASDMRRPIGIPAQAVAATSKPKQRAFTGAFRAAWLVDTGIFFAKPFAEVTVSHFRSKAFAEAGADALGLVVRSASRSLVSASPGVEIGTERRVLGDATLRPFLLVGGNFRSRSTWQTQASFAGAPSGVAPFTTSTRLPSNVGRVATGFDLLADDRASMRLQYESTFRGGYMRHSGSVKLGLRF